MTDDLLTITEVAGRLRRPAGTLRQWRHRGVGPRSFRIGRRVMYRRDDVDAWLQTQIDKSGSGESRAVLAAGASA